MKLTVFLILVSVAGVFASKSYSQTKMLNLNMRDATVKEVLNSIEKQSEFYFLFSENLIDVERKVNVDIENQKIDQVIDLMFKGTDVNYDIRDRIIVLTTPEVTGNDLLVQQQNSISGTVTDEAGEPLPGVTVIIKGITQGTVTNGNGKYSISQVPDDAVLVFSFVGMQTQEIEVGNQTTINIEMPVDAIGIEEVIAIGYGTIKKSDLTGSVSSVSTEDLSSISVSSVDQIMQGRVAGVQVTTSSGGPGASSSIKIRGVNSINSSSEPLYVIDGMPISANTTGDISTGGTSNNNGYSIMSSINPGDVESIEVLKDASATAIYGSRGANGVIIITTKRGKTGRSQIEFNANYGVSVVASEFDILGAEDYKIRFNEANEQKGNDIINFNDYYTEDNYWPDLVMRNSVVQNYQLSVNGGDEKTRFYISGSYFDEQGIIKESFLERYSGRVNVEHQPLEIVTIGTNLTYSHTDRALNDDVSKIVSNAIQFGPILPRTDPDGELFYPDYSYFNRGEIWAHHPIGEIYAADRGVFNDRILASAFGQIDITPALSFKSMIGLDLINATEQFYRYKNAGLLNGRAEVSQRRTYSFTNTNQLTYKKVFGNKHDVTGTLIQESTKATTQTIINNWDNFPTDALSFYGISTGIDREGIANNFREWTMLSFATRLSYIYNSKYLATLTVRRDGSSRFGDGNKWGIFPSGALAWRVSEENFMKSIDPVSNLKLRVSYGLTGNTDIGLYNSISTIGNYHYTSVDLRVIGSYPQKLPNKELKWESTEQTNIGIDLGLLQNRLSLTADYYNSVTNDLLLSVNIPHNSGYGSVLKNAGSVTNNGIEFSLNAVLVQSDFNWNVSGTLSRSVNKVTDLGGEHQISVSGQTLVVGQPLRNHYGIMPTGIFQTNEEILANPSRSADEPGVPSYVDANMDGKIDGNDNIIVGRGFPDFYYGLTSNMDYKNFDLFLYFSGVKGMDIFNQSRLNMANNTELNTLYEFFNNRWTEDNPSQEYPRTWAQHNGSSTEFLEDASYLRLKTLTFGYSFPVQRLNWISKARVYFTAQNLFTLTKYKGYDPEVNSNGQNNVAPPVDEWSYPRPRTFNFGINMNF